MKPFAILFLSSIALAFSLSVENVYHPKQKRSASPQLTIVPPNLNDPATVAVGGAAAIGGGLLLNHLLGDPAGKAIGNLLEGNRNQNRRPINRPPTNVQHHHHHYIPEYEEYQEASWSAWAPWQNSVCSKSCGTGTMNQQRTRHCSHGSNACVGHAEEAQQASCNTQQCPVDGFWQAYSEWKDDSTCSRSCGGGTRRMVRHRQCIGPYGGGRPCVGSSEDIKTIPCNSQACPTHGVWGQWKELSSRQSCRATCGAGTVSQARERTCIGPYNGGRPCVGESYTESCVEDQSYNSGGQYTPVPSPNYGVGNSAISPRTLGDRALSDNSDGQIKKPIYNVPRQPRKITSSETKSSSLHLYDGILTPSTPDKEEISKEIRKPVYGSTVTFY